MLDILCGKKKTTFKFLGHVMEGKISFFHRLLLTELEFFFFKVT
jgi:hypothetical protein